LKLVVEGVAAGFIYSLEFILSSYHIGH
jgi:hypothetical protein